MADEKIKAEKPEAKKFAAPTHHDYEVIDAPHITEKTMALMQNANKVTVKVADDANKIEIKDAFQRIFNSIYPSPFASLYSAIRNV